MHADSLLRKGSAFQQHARQLSFALKSCAQSVIPAVKKMRHINIIDFGYISATQPLDLQFHQTKSLCFSIN